MTGDHLLLWISAVASIFVVLALALVATISHHRRVDPEDVGAGRVAVRMVLAAGFFALTIIAFTLVTASWMSGARMLELDHWIHDALLALEAPVLIELMQVLTWFGSFLATMIAAAILAIYFLCHRDLRQLVNTFIVFVAGSGVLWLLKLIFARDRPEAPLAPTAGHSFPSGHSFSATVLYGFLIYVVWMESSGQAFRIGLTIFLAALMTSVLMSRLLLAAHWTSDVVGGFLFGLAWLVSSLMFTRAALSLLPERMSWLQSDRSST